MVKFGYDETSEAFEKPDETLEILPSSEENDGPLVDAEIMRIPGSFITISPVQTHLPDLKLTDNTIREKHALSSHGKNETSYYNHDDYVDYATAEIADASLVDEQQDVSMRDETDAEETQTSSTTDEEPILRQNTWYVQSMYNKSRMQLLQESEVSLQNGTNHKRADKMSKVLYTAHELDDDLFGGRIMAKQYTSSSQSGKVDHFKSPRNSAKLKSTPFTFRWTNRGMLIGKVGNLLRLVEHAQLASTTDIGRVDACLKERLKHTDISMNTRGVPCATLRSSLTASAIQKIEMDKDVTSVWQLTSALFDVSRDVWDTQAHIIYQERARKSAVSSWLRSSVMSLVAADELLAQSQTELIYAKLTGFQLEEACSIALKSGDFRLATILPLAGGDREVQHAIIAQIADWQSTRSTKFIDKFHRRLYTILSGSLTMSDSFTEDESSDDPSSILNLDWKRAFGLSLWYGTPAEATIGDALQEFERTIQGPGSNLKHTVSISPLTDIHYHILKASDSAEANISALLDYRKYPGSNYLQQLHLWLLSSFLFQNPIFLSMHSQQDQQRSTEAAIEFDQIILALAELLLVARRFDWAIFVVLHLIVETTRENAIKIILGRNIDDVSDDLSDLLVRTFLIPRIWLQEAKALSLRAKHQFDAEALCLLDAALYNEVHTMLLRHLAPQSIISGKFDSVYQILCKLSQIPSIEGWQHGGAVYKMAIEIIRTAKECASSEDRTSAKHRSTRARRLIVSVSSMQTKHFEQAVAKTELIMLLTNLFSSTELKSQSSQSVEEMKHSTEFSALRFRSMAHFRDKILTP